jgi:hypothetical protein
MARSIAEPPSVQDGMSPGDTILAHTPEAARPYQDAAAAVRRRELSGMVPESAQAAQAVQAPSGGRVDAVLAGQARAKRIGQLQADANRYLQEAQRFPAAASGTVDPYQADRQRQLRNAAEGVEIEIRELSELSGDDLISWAIRAGAIRFTPAGSALI